jgi:hypothetical protein
MCASHLPKRSARRVSTFVRKRYVHTTVSVTKGVGVHPRGGIRFEDSEVEEVKFRE